MEKVPPVPVKGVNEIAPIKYRIFDAPLFLQVKPIDCFLRRRRNLSADINDFQVVGTLFENEVAPVSIAVHTSEFVKRLNDFFRFVGVFFVNTRPGIFKVFTLNVFLQKIRVKRASQATFVGDKEDFCGPAEALLEGTMERAHNAKSIAAAEERLREVVKAMAISLIQLENVFSPV